MDNTALTKSELKELMRETVKETLAELLAEKQELIEILEDHYFGKMMLEADNQEFAEEKDVLKELNG